jgi:hypothetical protein
MDVHKNRLAVMYGLAVHNVKPARHDNLPRHASRLVGERAAH